MTQRAPETDPQNSLTVSAFQERGPVQLGAMMSHVWRSDPKRFTFVLSRYKFCARMLEGRGRVLEVGCADGFGARIVLQHVGEVVGVDIEQAYVDWANRQAQEDGVKAHFLVQDITEGAPEGPFDAAYSLDMIEHLDPSQEEAYLANVRTALAPQGAFIVGTPNIAASAHASYWSQIGHINLKSAATLCAALEKHFYNVFMFSMNDEVVHTGFHPMAHYLFALAVGPRPLD